MKKTEEFERFDEAMDKIMSVSYEELQRRLKAEKEQKEAEKTKGKAVKPSQSPAHT